ncbi:MULTISPECIES: hypothetical protein [unclassified Nostoc]|uniref:hypothetical protein n=1 Tax=unclassified Nostoc TaxID=2593658 RepID=UPI001677D2AE|nr:hypothetical protein [Nostoc sp. 'Peltigera membranacea cyanobiont' 232]
MALLASDAASLVFSAELGVETRLIASVQELGVIILHLVQLVFPVPSPQSPVTSPQS